MIERILNAFEMASREHKEIKSFRYGMESHQTSVGTDIYPQVLVEDPIYSDIETLKSKVMGYQINFDVLNNLNDEWFKVGEQQHCNTIAKQIILKVRDLLLQWNFEYTNIDFLTIEKYSDNNLVGSRVSISFNMDNPFMFCNNEEWFDIDKVFDETTSKVDGNTNGFFVLR